MIVPSLAFALYALSSACAPKDCAALADTDERDWCYFRLSEAAIEAGQIDPAADALARIGSPLVRAMGVDRVLAYSTQQQGQAYTKKLCALLDTNQAEACNRTWSRPHLWGEH